MRIGKAFSGIALATGLLAFVGLVALAGTAAAHPPADDFVNPQPGGHHLTLMPFVGPGFRATYDARYEIEKDMSEIRTQVVGTVAPPFSEVSANVDARFFLLTFGASIGYHNDWRNLQFNPDPQTGKDRLGQDRYQVSSLTADPFPPSAARDPTPGYADLNRAARAIKDQNADVTVKRWAFEELRFGFLWPAYNFVASNQFFARHENRPDVSFDWEQGTVYNSGWNFRWEGYFLFHARNLGFAGPALRAAVLPRNRTRGDAITPSGNLLPDDSACQPGVVPGLKCVGTHEFEFYYGFIAGMRPNWVNSSDTFLIRAYTTYGLNNQIFGTQTFGRQPIQFLFAYMFDIDL